MDELAIQKKKEYKAAWYQANKERVKVMRRERYLANKESHNTSVALYRAANRDKVRVIQARYRRKNSAYYVAKCAERYAKKVGATPVWADEFIISEIYELAVLRTKATGIEWQVDHIIPLRSSLVCGLHCEKNLRVITARENILKNNRYWPDMPS